MKKSSKILNFFLVLLITLLITCVFMYFKNIFPFGKNNYLNGMNEVEYLPILYNFWECLHGNGSFIYNFLAAMGSPMFAQFTLNGLFSPTTIIIGLFSKDNIINIMSYILIIKMLQISFISYYSFNKLINSKDNLFKIVISLCYTFSGIVFLSFYNLAMLDIISLFPLLMLGIKKLIEDNKSILYIITITLMLIINSYYSIIGIVFSFIIGILYIILVNKDYKKIISLCLSLIIGFGISSFIWIPQYYQMFNTTLVDKVIRNMEITNLGVFYLIIIYLLSLGLFVLFMIKQIIKDKGNRIFMLISILLLVILTIIDYYTDVNSLVIKNFISFDISYIVTFMLLLYSLLYLTNIKYKNIKKINYISLIGSLLIIGIYILFFIVMKDTIMSTDLNTSINMHAQIIGLLVFFVISILYGLTIFNNRKDVNKILLISYLVISSSLCGYMYIGKSYESTLDNIDIIKDFNLYNNGYKYVDKIGGLSSNNSYVYNISSMNHYSNMMLNNETTLAGAFKYYSYDTIVGTNGGSIFTNLLLGNKYYFSLGELDKDLYEVITKKNNIYYLSSKNNINYLIPYNGKEYNEDYGSGIENQNNLYHKLFDKEDNIIDIVDGTNKDGVYKYDLKPGNVYYLYMNCDVNKLNQLEEFDKVNIEVDEMYITEGNLFVVVLSVDKKTSIELSEKKYKIYSLEVGSINKDKFKKFSEELKTDTTYEYNIDSIKYVYNNVNDNKNVLIPLSYNKDLIIEVNGKEVKYSRNLYNLISINVDKGINTIEIKYNKNIFNISGYISIISLCIYIISIIVKRRIIK